MKSFGSKRKPRVIKVDEPEDGENAPDAPAKEAPVKEAESNGT